MQIKYAAPYLDYSGYGHTSRQHIAAFEAAGIKVNGELLSYSSEKADYGKLTGLMHDITNRGGDYNIKVLHATPDEYKRLAEKGKYNIGFCYWETDRIPESFADGLQYVDEIWTASQANVDAIKNAGVKKPIYIFPQPQEVDIEWPDKYEIPAFEGYLFYSIFEWTDRKNPEVLIRAFLEEFDEKRGVGLLIKTYFRNFSYVNKKMIRSKIELIKSSMALKNPPPIFLYLDLMDNHQILRFHKTGNCFVSPNRGEGWGIPQVEAVLAGNKVITTGYGGVAEYLENTNANILPYKMKKLQGMTHSRFYEQNQNWADVSQKDVQSAMREAYNNRDQADENTALSVVQEFNFTNVGDSMANRLKKIEAKL